jgi:hypothetical protein
MELGIGVYLGAGAGSYLCGLGTRAGLRNKKIARACPAPAVKWANAPFGPPWKKPRGVPYSSAEKAVLFIDAERLWGGLKEPKGPITVCSAEDWATILAMCEPLRDAGDVHHLFETGGFMNSLVRSCPGLVNFRAGAYCQLKQEHMTRIHGEIPDDDPGASGCPMTLEDAPPGAKETQERFDRELPQLKITVQPRIIVTRTIAGDSEHGSHTIRTTYHWEYGITVEQPKAGTGLFAKK